MKTSGRNIAKRTERELTLLFNAASRTVIRTGHEHRTALALLARLTRQLMRRP